jgi:hypothetical protein
MLVFDDLSLRIAISQTRSYLSTPPVTTNKDASELLRWSLDAQTADRPCDHQALYL